MAIDAACAMINRSIDLAEQEADSRYLLDYTKVHKLLYIAHCQMLATYGRKLFDEDVRAHRCGPLVEGIDSIPAKFGFDIISQKIPPTFFVMPSFLRLSIIDWTLQRYGSLEIEDLVAFAMGTPAYEEIEGEITQTNKPKMKLSSMAYSAPSIMV